MLLRAGAGEIQREMHLSASPPAMIGPRSFRRHWRRRLRRVADRFGGCERLLERCHLFRGHGPVRPDAHCRQLLTCRLLLVRDGREWASAPRWWPRPWPARHRAKALALVQSSWLWVTRWRGRVALVMPRFGWRAVFFAGIVPALIAFWVRRGLREPEAWQRQRAPRVPIGQLFAGRWPGNADLCHMNAATSSAGGGSSPGAAFSFARRRRGRARPLHRADLRLDHRHAGRRVLGYVICGYLADRFGRKSTYIGYLAMAALTVPLFAFVRDPRRCSCGPVVGFFATGCFSGFSSLPARCSPPSCAARPWIRLQHRPLTSAARRGWWALSERSGSALLSPSLGRICAGCADRHCIATAGDGSGRGALRT